MQEVPISLDQINIGDVAHNPQNAIEDFKSCRICLLQARQHLEPSNDHFITPCKCTGSLGHVHEKCLITWANSIVQRNLQMNKNTPTINCQICREQFIFETNFKFQLMKPTKIKKTIKQYIWVFVICIVFIVASIAVVGYLASLITSGKVSMDTQNVDKIAVIACIALLAVVAIMWVIKILLSFIFRKVHLVCSIKNRYYNKPAQGRQMPQQQSGATFLGYNGKSEKYRIKYQMQDSQLSQNTDKRSAKQEKHSHSQQHRLQKYAENAGRD